MILEKTGNKIRTIRLSKGLTQEQMADLLNMSHSGYSKLERGETDMTLVRLEELAKIFQMSLIEILQFGENSTFNFNMGNIQGFGVSNSSVYVLNKAEDIDLLQKEVQKLKESLINLEDKLKL
jgi:transcriptional regulator with XRE-family HTH domain